jgi:2-succinyl-5-enolpyruvyl-6-hydroxy-3-cyclohexene-1-carboxylate synthase
VSGLERRLNTGNILTMGNPQSNPPSEVWGQLIVQTLEALGVQFAVTCPGSRSTPLTVPLALSTKIRTFPILDERSAAFFALGLARRSHRPVALVCTSGTAAANFYPAIIEARYAGVPLLILTADRPPEMRDNSSGQTIRQTLMFGEYPVWFHEMATPGTNPELLAYARETITQAAWRSLGPIPGPVHLNIPFRDPLTPTKRSPQFDQPPARLFPEGFFSQVDELPQRVPHPATKPPRHENDSSWLVPVSSTRSEPRGLIIAGTYAGKDPTDHAAALLRLAHHLHTPILADVLNPVRFRASVEDSVIAHYDPILRQESTREHLRPDFVIHYGPPPTSKVLRQWLQHLAAEVWLLPSGAENTDPLHRAKRRLPNNWQDLALALPEPGHLPESAYLQLWLKAEVATRKSIQQKDLSGTPLRESSWPIVLSSMLGSTDTVVLANSMAVRDAEWFWSSQRQGPQIFCNRGANGIDGTLSTALGIAVASRQPTTLVTGDLAFLHDSNGLLNSRHLSESISVIVLNNNGGGIFGNLPIAEHNPPFQDYFLTPQAVSIEHLCLAHGIPHASITSALELEAFLKNRGHPGLRVAEVILDRDADLIERREFLHQLSSCAG